MTHENTHHGRIIELQRVKRRIAALHLEKQEIDRIDPLGLNRHEQARRRRAENQLIALYPRASHLKHFGKNWE